MINKEKKERNDTQNKRKNIKNVKFTRSDNGTYEEFDKVLFRILGKICIIEVCT